MSNIVVGGSFDFMKSNFFFARENLNFQLQVQLEVEVEVDPDSEEVNPEFGFKWYIVVDCLVAT